MYCRSVSGVCRPACGLFLVLDNERCAPGPLLRPVCLAPTAKASEAPAAGCLPQGLSCRGVCCSGACAGKRLAASPPRSDTHVLPASRHAPAGIHQLLSPAPVCFSFHLQLVPITGVQIPTHAVAVCAGARGAALYSRTNRRQGNPGDTFMLQAAPPWLVCLHVRSAVVNRGTLSHWLCTLHACSLCICDLHLPESTQCDAAWARACVCAHNQTTHCVDWRADLWRPWVHTPFCVSFICSSCSLSPCWPS